MAKDAEAHAAEDKDARDAVEARNGLDSLVYNIEKMLKDSSGKVAESDKSEVESALAEAKSVLAGTPGASELNAAKDKLQTASHKLAEAMYKAGSSAPTDGGAAAAGTADTQDAGHDAGKEEGVIDAEYVDVDKK